MGHVARRSRPSKMPSPLASTSLSRPDLGRDVDLAVDDRDALRLLQAGRDLGVGHLGRSTSPCTLRDPVELPLDETCAAPHVSTPCGRPGTGDAGDVRLEARRAQVAQRVVRVDLVSGKPSPAPSADALALLDARGDDAHDAALGRQHGVRDDLEGGLAGALPRQLEHLAAAGLEVVDPELVLAGGQRDVAVLGRAPCRPSWSMTCCRRCRARAVVAPSRNV